MPSVKTSTGDEFVVGVIRSGDGAGRLLARESLTADDFRLPRDETWWQGVRAGVLGTDLSALSVQVLPGDNSGPDRLEGYSIELREDRRTFRRHFALASLAPVARRAARRLLEQGGLGPGEEFAYFLTTVPAGAETASPKPPGPGLVRRTEPPVLEPARLADFVQRSEPLSPPGGPEDEGGGAAPVFVPPEVWRQAHELARRGGEQESAAVLTGHLFRDTESPEVFLVLDACLEAEYATEEPYAVTFSGATWARIREVLDQRRRRLDRPRERILGVVHGHNFLPPADEDGKRTCERCPVSAVCSRTTAAHSAADLEWHRAVFAGQPWTLSLIWGYNAREEEDWRLFGLANASLAPRPIRRLTT